MEYQKIANLIDDTSNQPSVMHIFLLRELLVLITLLLRVLLQIILIKK